MSIKSSALACMLAAAIAGPTYASDWRADVDLEKADLSQFSMQLILNGQKAGSMTYGWEKKGDTIYVRDRTEMQPNILETAEAAISATSLLPHSVLIDFAMGDDSMKFDLKWHDGWRTGQNTADRNGERTVRDVNLQEDTPAPLRLAVIGFIAALPLEQGYTQSLPWFNTMANRVETVTASVRGNEMVETPAGTFDTWVVDLKGGSPENVLYVTKSLPRKIARIDVVGQPMHFLRTGS